MGNRKKSVLNQIVEEPKKEIIVNINEEDVKDLDEKFNVDADVEIKEIIREISPEKLVEQEEYIFELPKEEPISIDDVLTTPDFEISTDMKIDEQVVGEDDKIKEVLKPRTLESLSRAEMRWFQRTGRMPK